MSFKWSKCCMKLSYEKIWWICRYKKNLLAIETSERLCRSHSKEEKLFIQKTRILKNLLLLIFYHIMVLIGSTKIMIWITNLCLKTVIIDFLCPSKIGQANIGFFGTSWAEMNIKTNPSNYLSISCMLNSAKRANYIIYIKLLNLLFL